MFKNMFKNTKNLYSTCTWICIIILVFIIGALFNYYFNDPKPTINSEHFFADPREEQERSIKLEPNPSPAPVIGQSKTALLNPFIQEYSRVEPNTDPVGIAPLPSPYPDPDQHSRNSSNDIKRAPDTNPVEIAPLPSPYPDPDQHSSRTGLMGFSFNDKKYSSIGLTPTPSP